jgi:rubrerythrin
MAEVEYFSGLFSIARPPSQEAREAEAYLAEVTAREAAAYLAEVDAREAARQEAAHAANSAREMHLISLADAADLPKSAAVEEKVCVICHEALVGGQRLAATGCGHVFCAGCISMGLRHKDVCPTCRTKKPTVTVLYI